MTGWVGTLLLLVGAWLVAHRRRAGFLWSLAGNLLWVARAVELSCFDLAAEAGAFVALAALGWFKWRRKEK